MRSTYWLPNMNSWLSSIVLMLLTGGLATGVSYVWRMGMPIVTLVPRLAILVSVVAMLSPIALIAIAHHMAHRLFDRFFPETRSSDIPTGRGVLPGLMSWWEGLYGWLVILLATLVCTGILAIFLPWSHFDTLYPMLTDWNKFKYLLTVPMVVWIVLAAYLYHLEHLVQRHLIAVGAQQGRA